MQKINFKNLPDKSTPINAANLNKLQDNVEASFNVLNNYSTEEKVVGTWYNGKPIYRQVFVNRVLSNTTTLSNEGNFEHIVNVNGNIDSIEGLNCTFGQSAYFDRPEEMTRIVINNSNHNLMLNANTVYYQGCYFAVCVEYTKTTDLEVMTNEL